jgi:hypothetical protein
VMSSEGRMVSHTRRAHLGPPSMSIASRLGRGLANADEVEVEPTPSTRITNGLGRGLVDADKVVLEEGTNELLDKLNCIHSP